MANSPPSTPDKAWVTLITNDSYLPGLLTLNHSLRSVKSAYPLIALYTPSFPASGLAALSRRGITALPVPYLSPRSGKKYVQDERFNDCWTKLVVFSLTQFTRLVQLDSDMLVLRNMDELMALPLDTSPTSTRLFASGHACVCNPLRKAHYPSSWVPENCAFTHQHPNPDKAQVEGADPARSLGDLNSGLLVVQPSRTLFDEIVAHMDAHGEEYTFPDQDLLADLYRGRWVPLPYVYNALKTMRSEDVHGAIWRDAEVKNVHYILSPKPWAEVDDEGRWKVEERGSEIFGWWVDANRRRLQQEKEEGIVD